jgi:octaprenyl-diphosphate synthase
MQKGSPEQSQTIRLAIENGDLDALQHIVAIVRQTGALEATQAAAAEEAKRAIPSLDPLPPSPYRAALHQLAAQLLNRRT